ncbi:MAG: serine/threonine protein kinase with sensor(s), partial [Humibacillus sp.]|nr:serine/threonine protein kinase with sensor(s) [Humibacillus sp.]
DAVAFRADLENVRLGRSISAAALGTGAAIGAAATQTLPSPYAVTGAATMVQPAVTTTTTTGPPDPRDDEQRGGNGRRGALIAILALVVLGLIGWGAVSYFGQQPETVTVSVPRITGLTEQTALRALRTANLQGQQSADASTTVAKGSVISQDPAAGARANEGDTIQFVVSTGPDNGAVPDVTGADKEAARKTLEDAGFTVSKFVEENSPDQAKDKVTKTDPPGNAQAAQGSAITVYYATGNVTVPKGLVGRDYAVVAPALADAGVNPVSQQVDSDKAPGTVLEVAKEGAVVKAGTDITVKVARAPSQPPQTVTQTTTQTQSITVTPPPVTETAPTPTPTPTTPTDTGTGTGTPAP